MPKDNIDYSNTIIYKIYCIDEAITDTYVGHTTQFIQRKHHHKSSCNNSKNVLKIYKTIRENGGWDNWNMIELAKYNCKDSTEARIKEQQHYEELNSTLNSCPPYVDKQKYFCINCNLQCNSLKQFDKHINCKLHITTKPIETNKENEQILEKTIMSNSSFKFYCKKCDYGTSKKSSFVNHIASIKHKNTISENHLEISGNQIMSQLCSLIYTCSFCYKEFKNRSGLWKHKQKCNNNTNNNTSDKISDQKETEAKELIQYLLKENSEFKQLMIDQNKQMLTSIQEQNKNMLELAKNFGNYNTANN